jgi:hypothetical protein
MRKLLTYRNEYTLEPEPPTAIEITALIVFILAIAVCLALIIWPSTANAQGKITVKSDDIAINIIVGEASGEGFQGMQAVGEVLRRSKSWKGFYGAKGKHNRSEPKSVWIMARKAWQASKTSNITRDADHFENIEAFGRPYWADSCQETVKIGHHTFFKCQKGV